MNLFKRKIQPNLTDYISTNLETIESSQDFEIDDLEFFVKIIEFIRPKHPKAIEVVHITELLDNLKANDFFRKFLSKYIKAVLNDKKFNKTFSDSAILQDVDFIFELKKRIYAKLLPYQAQKDTLEFVLNQVFYLQTDANWIDKIPQDELLELYNLLDFGSMYESIEPRSSLLELMNSLNLLTQRISGRAMESDVIKMVPEFDGFESPFEAFEKELRIIEEHIKNSYNHYVTIDDISYKQLLVLHHQCEKYVDTAFKNSSKYGISLRVNQNLLRIRQQLERLKILLPLLAVENSIDEKKNGIKLALLLIKYNCYKNNVRKFIAESTQLISYEITQHTAKTGEHYITEGKREYFRMLRTAIGGGFIVGFLCIFKLLLGKVETSYFGHAFLYSMNYSLGFISIYLLGFTLATKQPAMTAAALVRAIEEGKKKDGSNTEKYSEFAKLFARVFRSQFIAFVGNVLMAFPIAFLLIYAYDYIFGINIAAAKWEVLITDISPVHSLAIFHAAIAGVFLFLSGIISGSVANRDKHSQVYFRIQEHPLLKKSLGKKTTKKLADIYEKKWAGIISNFWFGIFMGSTGIIGLFLGLNIDIRHITFASGNLALAWYGSEYTISNMMIFWGVLGVGLIGLANFLVSFLLSLSLAFRSRNISIFELRFVGSSIWKHFKSKPMSFFFPTERRKDNITTAEEKITS